MPPRPFPLQLSLGIDICHVPRIQKLLERASRDRDVRLRRYMQRFLTSREQAEFWSRYHNIGNVYGTGLKSASMYLAGRWAAKEAVIKAVNWRRVGFLQVQILSRQNRDVYAVLWDRPASPIPPDARKKATQAETGSRNSEIATVTEAVDSTVENEESTTHSSTIKEDFIPPNDQDDNAPGQIAKISISHDGEYATAVCLVAEEPDEGDVGGEAFARGFQ